MKNKFELRTNGRKFRSNFKNMANSNKGKAAKKPVGKIKYQEPTIMPLIVEEPSVLYGLTMPSLKAFDFMGIGTKKIF